MLLTYFILIYLINDVISLSSQEDLSINKYTQIACIKFHLNQQFIVNNIQENFLLPYQTFSSSSMSIELCFRLCRRWFILISNNQTNCICLYTINERYEISEYLGEILPNENCTLNDVQIYSLTDDIQILPTLSTSVSDDWSFDGCYYLHGIQTIRVNLQLTNTIDYIEAIDLCRKHCRTFRETNYYSYYLSRKKSCYCLPINYSQTNQTIALRKPLRHCSFHPYICLGFTHPCENYYSDTSLDTLIKIDVQHYCLSTDFQSFVFDEIFVRCFNSVSLQTQMNFQTINYDQKCLPLIIKTAEQWNYFTQSTWINYSKLFFAIDRNSTYIFNELFRYSNLTLLSIDLCIMIYRTESNKIFYELMPCTDVRLPGYVLCTQKPFPSVISNEDEFENNRNDQTENSDNNEILSCPSGFVLFNKICYYIHTSFVYNIQNGERVCYNQNSNSSLVKFDLHEWGNINTTKFLGRRYEDILLEFFYYLLERKLLEQTIDESTGKHWLRLLLGDKNDPNECILRYFVRSSGAFTTVYQCINGGHPVCECEPIRTKSSSPPIEITTPEISLNNSTVPMSICENCTATPPADEDLFNNETQTMNDAPIPIVKTQSNKNYLNYRPLIVILSGPGLALMILIIGVILLVLHLRKNTGLYSRRSSAAVGSGRMKRSSTILTNSDTAETPAVLYTRLKPSQIHLMENEMLLPFDHSIPFNSETIEILNDDNKINEHDELIYPKLN